ncbi:MAG: 2-succinyl-6-hydroxy-2,4-cyclohexadiene-1-carboxylate synthase [Arthrospira sp. SH-MAG29]|nr:2-succinyl-6-hydroxy-2,4-cyclohexadiene-1-carboxylate synthase [Arthrospira sp. SH-MAG29]MBS0017874.1 2-succinyl-6-hydroxy-2,4-cyclohexadiene-1-carboxylate synthase [Arthrospira sp. SH-MAG29]
MPQWRVGCYSFYGELQGDRSQPLILLLHGFMGNCRDFDPAISSLSDDFCCLTIDLPGQGKTQVLAGDEAYQIPAIASGLIGLLDYLKIDNCVLIGYSMGGRLGLYLILHYPTRFKQAILESASPGLKTEIERSQRRLSDDKIADQLQNIPFQDFLNWWYSLPLFTSFKNSPNFPKIIGDRLKNNPTELAKILINSGTGTQPQLWDKLSQNQIPLLLLVGEFDHKFQQLNREITDLCTLATIKIVPGCGHNIHRENPRIWGDLILDFIS